MQRHGPGVHPDIGDPAARPHHPGAGLEAPRAPDGLDHHIGAEPIGEIAHQPLRVLGGIRHRVGADPLGGVQPGWVRIDGDDPAGGEEVRRGDRGQPDRPGAHHHDRIARPHLAVEDAHLVGGGEDIRQQDGVMALGRPRQRIRGQIGERHPDVLGLGAVDHAPENPAPAVTALSVVALPAEAAVAAGRDAGEQHPVAGPDLADIGTGLDDLADPLVAEHPAGADARQLAAEDMQIGAADGRGVDPDDGVGGGLEFGVGHLLPGGLLRPVEDECFHGRFPLLRLFAFGFRRASQPPRGAVW
ncbi:hypothetical protein SANT12839_083730 [Streptomyces antimycoticus]|uniref:Uncharacterized protein n=1 Tax=Streptomyces antimycoticus TaxID=68175 RepID=A0A4D4KE85_9ACTN|nr:hypothetical protein SANT12839_083730 [Streptomyces antimycoticus]